MDEQRAWIRSRRRKRLRIVAVVLCVCLLVTTRPDILAALSTFASEWKDSTVYVSGFGELPEEVRAQNVPVGTGVEELSLPDTLEAFAETPEEEGKPEDAENPGDGSGETGNPGDGEGGTENLGDETGETGNPSGGEDGTENPGDGNGETGKPDDGEGGTENPGDGNGETGNPGGGEGGTENPDDGNGETGNPGGGEGGTENPGDGSGDTGNPGEGNGNGSDDAGNTDEGTDGAGEQGGETGNPGEESGGTSDDAGNMDEGNSGAGEPDGDSSGSEPESSSDSAPANDEGGAEAADETAKGYGDALNVQRGAFVMPVYMSEPETSAEPQTMERKEESVMIKGVTWQSEPAYDGSVEGTYVFTAVLPDGYALTEGTSLPQITVTVQGTDPVVQELLTRIAALPEAEDYLADEPDVEEEDKYEAWMDELSTYTAEALDLWEMYETFTEEQRTLVPTEALVKLAAWVEVAGQLAEGIAVAAETETVTLTVNLWRNGSKWGGQNVTLKIRDGDYYPASEIETGVYQGIVAKGGDYFPCLDGKSIGQNFRNTDNGDYSFTFRYVTVTYEKDGATGTAPEEESYYCGLSTSTMKYTVKKTLPLTKAGYVQTGWSETSGGSGNAVTEIIVNQGTGVDGIRTTPIVLYPVFEPATVTFNATNCAPEGIDPIESGVYETTVGESGDYSVNFMPDSGYKVPAEVTVRIGDTTLDSGKYTYENGMLTIPRNQITGNITIDATAETKFFTIAVRLKLDGSAWGGQTVTLKKGSQEYPATELSENGAYQAIVEKGGRYTVCVNGEQLGWGYNTDSLSYASDTLNYVTVTYMSDGAGGTVPEQELCYCAAKSSGARERNYTVDTTLPLTKTGYAQTGWSVTSGGEAVKTIQVNAGGGGEVRTTPIILYPVFTPATVTINATNCTHNGASEVANSGNYTVTFTPEAGYDVPAGVTVEIGSTTLGTVDYTYNDTTGTLTIPRDKITGHVTITAEAAQHRHSLAYKVSGQTIVESCSKCDHSVAAGFKTTQSAPYTYTGSAIEPFDVSYTGGTWLWSIKPVISYTSNTNAGTATATLTYNSLRVEKTFTIDKKDISDDSVRVSLSTNAPTYTGSAITPTVTVEDGSRTLAKDTDYTVSYQNNTAVGPAAIIITGKGNYTGTRTEQFTIAPKSLALEATWVTVSLGTDSRQYTGQAIEPALAQVTVRDKILTPGTDYTVSYNNNINAGSNAQVIITGQGNYTDTCTKTFKIEPKPLTDAMVTMTSTSYPYTGNAIIPAVTVKDGSTTLTKGTDYTVSCQNNTDVSTTARVTITGEGNYAGTLTKTFAITAKSLADVSVTLPSDSYPYTGKAITPDVTVKDGSRTLAKDTDYTVTYADNTAVGTNTAKVTVTGTGNYTGECTLTFTIQDKEPDIPVDDLDIDYSGGTVKLPDDIKDQVEIYDSKGNKITPNPDGSLPVEPGNTITIKYPGSDKEIVITIPGRPAAPETKKVTVTDTTATVSNPAAGEEYVLVAREGTPDWSKAKVDTTFTGLTPNTAYDLYVRKQATKDSFASEPAKTQIRTTVTIKKPETGGAGAGKEGNDVSEGKPSADGGSVTYTGTCEEGSTPVIIVGGKEIIPEITWDEDGKKGTWSYTVPVEDGKSEVGIQVAFKDRAYTGLKIEPGSLHIYADDTANQNADRLLDYLKAHCTVMATYDNGTSDDMTNGADYKADRAFNAKGAVYEYTLEVNAETGKAVLTVSPVTAAVKTPDALAQTPKSGGYTKAEVDAWLPKEVAVTYTGADGYAQRTESRPVTWKTDALGADFGATAGSKTISGMAALPEWAAGENTVSIEIGFLDRNALTDNQMHLSISGWAYGAQTAPAPEGSVTVTDTEQTYRYRYSADNGASWVTADGLPKSGSGNIIPGDYQVEMTYTGKNYTGTKTAAFTVVQKPVTAEKGTLAVEKRNYDGTTKATLKAGGKPALVGVIENDDVALGGTLKAVFTDKGPKKDIPVTVTGFSLTGSEAGYYKLVNTTLTLKATINNKDGSSSSGGSSGNNSGSDNGDSGDNGDNGNSSDNGDSGGDSGNGGNTGTGGSTGSGGNTGTGGNNGGTGGNSSGTGNNKGTGSTGGTGEGSTGNGNAGGTDKGTVGSGTGKGGTGNGNTTGTGKGSSDGTEKGGSSGTGKGTSGTGGNTTEAESGTAGNDSTGNGGSKNGAGTGNGSIDGTGSGSTGDTDNGTGNGDAGARQEGNGQQTKSVTVQTVQAEADDGKIVISGETEAPVAIGTLTEDAPGATRLLVGEGIVTVTVVCEDDQYTVGMNDATAVANAVLTPEQIQRVDEGESLEIRVDIRDISQSISPQDRETVENGYEAYGKYLSELKRGGYVDISVYMKTGDGGWNAVSETTEPLEIVIGIPEELWGEGREYYIIRAHEGRYTLLNDMDAVPETITVVTDLFSSYAIAYREVGGAETGNAGMAYGLSHISPKFLGIVGFIWLMAAAAGIIVVIIVLRRKRGGEKKTTV